MMRILAITLLLGLTSVAAAQENVWVSDQFEVMLRTGPSTSNAIERMLPSGTALEVLERDDDAGYARVRTAAGTDCGHAGRQPGARGRRGTRRRGRPRHLYARGSVPAGGAGRLHGDAIRRTVT